MFAYLFDLTTVPAKLNLPADNRHHTGTAAVPGFRRFSMLPPPAIQKFRESLLGQSFCPGEPGYDAARTIHNAMVNRRPVIVACCTGAADVIGSVLFAREYNLPLSVRGGGHSVAGKSVCDDGLMVNLSAMKGIRVDPAKRTVRAEAGLKLSEFDRETQ